jgi:hypothetical protein
VESSRQKALREAIEQFEARYRKFVGKHKQYYTVEVDVDTAVAQALKTDDIHKSAEVFRHEMSSIIEARNRKEDDKSKKWVAKWEKFVQHVYPVVKVSLKIVGKLGEVTIFSAASSNDPGFINDSCQSHCGGVECDFTGLGPYGGYFDL